MEYARHEAQLNQPDKDGIPARTHYEEHARRGRADAIEMLAGKECPVDLMYLYDWSVALVGRSGMTMGGLLPLSYSELKSFSDMTGWKPDPEEVEALMILDSILRNPDTEVKVEKKEEPKPTFVAAWPTRKKSMAD
jgi:hypothetical protein